MKDSYAPNSPSASRTRSLALASTWFALLLGTPFVAHAAPAPTGPAIAGLETCDQVMTALMEKGRIPGASLAIALDGRIIYARGFGYADQESGRLVQPDTRFRIASMSKPITAALTLKLVEQGRLSLDDRVFPLLNYATPTYAGAKRDARLDQITVRHLLTHTAGWNRDAAPAPFQMVTSSFEPTYYQAQVAGLMGVASPASAETTARFMVGQPLQFAPGTSYAYSNVGYLILGRFLEVKTGLAYEAAAQQFLAGAGISGAQVASSPRSQVPADEAVMYDYDGAYLLPSAFGEGMVPRGYCASMRTLDAHGGWAVSAIEYLRFLLALDGAGGTPRLLSAASVAAMRTEQYPASAYGFGWNTRFQPGGWSGHDGILPGGTRSWAIHAGDGRFSAVLMFNSYNESAAFDRETVTGLQSIETAVRALRTVDADLTASTLGWSAWQRKHFGETPAGALLDSDGDGVPNLIEYAAGLDPTRPDCTPAAALAVLSDGTPAFTYRRIVPEHGLTWSVEVPAGGSWQPSVRAPRTSVLNPDGTQSVTVLLPGATRARLRVTQTSTNASATLELATTAVPAARLLNLSTRGRAGQGADALIAGFVVQGTEPRTFLLRGVGAGLGRFGVTETLKNPMLRVFAANGREITGNDDWSANAAALGTAAHDVGAFALEAGAADAAVLVTLTPGAYTAQLVGADGGEGNGLVEIYEADRGASYLGNLSCRSRIGGAMGSLTTGFVIAGDKPRPVLVRAVGPALRGFGVSDALAAPVLTVYKEGVVLARNAGWSTGSAGETAALVAAMQRAGAFGLAAGSGDAALLVTLAPGAYTMQIDASGGASGVVLAEVYDGGM